MRIFKWIDWNLGKVDAHGLSAVEVEAAFDNVQGIERRRDGSFEMAAKAPSGRAITVVWRYDREEDALPTATTGLDNPPIFVITAY